MTLRWPFSLRSKLTLDLLTNTARKENLRTTAVNHQPDHSLNNFSDLDTMNAKLTFLFLSISAGAACTALSPSFAHAAPPASPAKPVMVLGLPLGGKLPGPIRICTPNEISSLKPTRFCWYGSPSRNDNYHYGEVSWPGGENRVDWAEHGKLTIRLGKDHVLEGFSVQMGRGAYPPVIRKSVAERFGTPFQVYGDDSVLRWSHRDALVELTCFPESGCKLDVSPAPTAAEKAAIAAEAAKKAAIEARRPKSM